MPFGLLALLCFPAAAQFTCTMPNGVVVVSKLSPCPADAVKAVASDGTVIFDRPQTKKPRTPPPVSVPLTQQQLRFQEPKATTAPTQPAAAKPTDRNIVDEAYAICVLLKTVGATTCDVNVKVLSQSNIDATLATTPQDATGVCQKVAELTHQRDSPFIGRGWELKIFSPLGSGTRPMASCRL